MARIAVTGAGGFIGANLTKRLHADGHDVLPIDIRFPSWRGVKGAVRDLTIPGEARSLRHVDYVFHLAADMGGVGYFHSDADLGAAMRNGRMTANVIDVCTESGIPMFYAASACAYPIEDMTAGRTLTEDRLGMGTPDALYGAEKLHGLRLCSKVEGARVGVFDTIYGPLQEHEGRRMKFPAAVATKALRARETGQLELWGDGTQQRTYLYIDDAIDRICTVAFSDHYDGPVNIGANTPVSCREIADLCLDILNVDAEIILNPTEPTGVPYRRCSSEKYVRTYGSIGETSYLAGFASFLEWLECLSRS